MTPFAHWAINFHSGVPVYRQIINFIYMEIGRGGLREGDRLPTIKELAEQLNVNPNTVAKAYHELDLKGTIAGRRGDGSFVSTAGHAGHLPTAEQKRAKLDELFGRVIAEAKAFGISEEELLQHVAERIREDG